jgi:hypothetical protein
VGATSHLFFARLNHSLIGESKQQQLAWLADRVTGDSPAIQEARELLRLAIIKQADSVLLMGETRTGKGRYGCYESRARSSRRRAWHGLPILALDVCLLGRSEAFFPLCQFHHQCVRKLYHWNSRRVV